MEPDFSGYVTKAGLKCADGRTITNEAFSRQDGAKVPVVYMHNHNDVQQVLGHAILAKKDDGVWGDVYLNKGPAGLHTKMLVQNGDLDKFSIWAKDLEEVGSMVHDGVIQEVSLVLAGANPGATVDNVLMHSGIYGDDDENLMVVGFEIMHADVEDPKPEAKPEEKPASTEEPKADDEETVADVLNTLTEKQQTAVNSVIEDVVTEAVTEALAEEPELTHTNIDSSMKGSNMPRNVFDRSKSDNAAPTNEMKHSDVQSILSHAKGTPGNIAGFDKDAATGSLKALVRSSTGKELMHADTYGVDNIEILFPDARALMNTPKFVDRRQEWVKTFLNGTSHSPFSRIKTLYADITADEARARGYIKGNRKVEEVFPVFKRTTGPAMIYKKQKLDRQDVIDITDFDVVAWMKVEMRGKLDEEIARAGLFGDGRPTMIGGDMNPDKIQEPTGTSGDGIRSVLNDDDLYTTTINVPMPATPSTDDYNNFLDTATESAEDYMGSGNKTAFMSYKFATKLLTIRDSFGKRVYRNLSEVAADMDVTTIERVPTSLMPTDVLAIVLDLRDYNFGTDRGGEITLFDDFDIDFNQLKYLMETYLSGALTLPYSAQVYKRVDSTDTVVTPDAPVQAGNVVTVPTQTGVVYKRTDTGATLTNASPVTLDEDTLPILEIEATPAADYYFPSNSDQLDTWTFEYQA